MEELYSKINYHANLPYIFSRYIREYDIQQANVTILREAKFIDEATYNRLVNGNKLDRQVYIGLLQKNNPKATEALQKGIVEAKRLLFEQNEITLTDVLAIKNDAVFVIDRVLNSTCFGAVRFIEKNIYTSYMKIFNLEFYYFLDRINSKEKLDVKGLGKSIRYHEEYMLDFIAFIFSAIETDSIEDVIRYFNTFYDDFVNRRLDVGYYRSLNSDSMYLIKNTHFKLLEVDNKPEIKESLDISHNLQILREIYSYITNKYFSK